MKTKARKKPWPHKGWGPLKYPNADNRSRPRIRKRLCFAALCAIAVQHPARAIETTMGDWQINIDTTLTTSTDIRASSQDHAFIGKVNGGTYPTPNSDNGNLNFKAGALVDAPQRITTEWQATHGDYGMFVRATGFYDPVINAGNIGFTTLDATGQPVRVTLSHAAQKDIGTDLRLLDAYIFARPEIFDHPIDVRIGNQVINWGESSFIQFGLSTITPLDITALHSTGAELRTAFLPIPAIDLKTNLAQSISIEGFWQPIWTRTKLDPVGSFYNTDDTLMDGGKYGVATSGAPDTKSSIQYINANTKDIFGGGLPRLLDHHPEGTGAYGVALREETDLFSGTELGLYYETYASRTPFGDYRTGDKDISPSFLGTTVLPTPIVALIVLKKPGFATRDYTQTACFFADYPSNIHDIGASFSLTGPTGIAIQGEISDRLNQPIQLAASDLGLAMESPAIRDTQDFAHTILKLGLTKQANDLISAYDEALTDPVIQMIGGIPGFNQNIQGWKRYNVTQAQTTFTKIWGGWPALNIDQTALIGEIGADEVNGFPRQSAVFDAAFATDSASAFASAASQNPNNALSTKNFATPFSAAYVIALQFEMPNTLPHGIILKPLIALQHDFLGTSPIGVNDFQANTAAATFSLGFSFLNQITANLGYTNHFTLFDTTKTNVLIDRDFYSLSVSYLF